MTITQLCNSGTTSLFSKETIVQFTLSKYLLGVHFHARYCHCRLEIHHRFGTIHYEYNNKMKMIGNTKQCKLAGIIKVETHIAGIQRQAYSDGLARSEEASTEWCDSRAVSLDTPV